MLEINSKAPDFSLPDENGTIHKLSDYLGKKIILYFYSFFLILLLEYCNGIVKRTIH